MNLCFHCPFKSEDYDSLLQHLQICTAGSQATPSDVAGVSTEQLDTTQQEEKCWSHEAVLLLIETYRLHQQRFSDGSKRKYQVWQDICKELQGKGYAVDGTACDQKMQTLRRRYEIIKDSATQSGRGAQSQWPYFTAMDDLLPGDPAIVPMAVATCFPVASTSGIHLQSPPAGVSEALVCSTPSPARSPTTSNLPVHSPSSSSRDSMMGPQPKRRTMKESPHKETFIQQVKLLETLISLQKERTTALTGFMNQLISKGLTPSQRFVEAEMEELRRKKKELQQRLLQQEEEHHREIMAMEKQYTKEIKDLMEQHQDEIKEILHQHQHEIIQEMQEQHVQQIMEMMLQRH